MWTVISNSCFCTPSTKLVYGGSVVGTLMYYVVLTGPWHWLGGDLQVIEKLSLNSGNNRSRPVNMVHVHVVERWKMIGLSLYSQRTEKILETWRSIHIHIIILYNIAMYSLCITNQHLKLFENFYNFVNSVNFELHLIVNGFWSFIILVSCNLLAIYYLVIMTLYIYSSESRLEANVQRWAATLADLFKVDWKQMCSIKAATLTALFKVRWRRMCSIVAATLADLFKVNWRQMCSVWGSNIGGSLKIDTRQRCYVGMA